MKKIAVLGKSSMSGHIIYDYFSKKEDFHTIGFEENEIFDNKSIIKKIDIDDCDYIVNCIRCLVIESEQNPSKSILFNTFLPQLISKKYKKSKIIHLSTDCVFSGKIGSYNEDSIHDGESNYSLTKSSGEVSSGNYINIRTSYIGPTLGDDAEELFDWFLSQSNDVFGYNHSFWNGVTTLELAISIDKLIELNFCGTYHLTGKTVLSKYDLLSKIKNIWSKNNINLIKKNNEKIDRSLVDNLKLIKQKDYDLMLNELLIYI